jgi:hypothetical protein
MQFIVFIKKIQFTAVRVQFARAEHCVGEGQADLELFKKKIDL